MFLTISCPVCSKKFTIEPLAAQREIERLKSENSVLRAKIAQLEQKARDNPFGNIFGGLGR